MAFCHFNLFLIEIQVIARFFNLTHKEVLVAHLASRLADLPQDFRRLYLQIKRKNEVIYHKK